MIFIPDIRKKNDNKINGKNDDIEKSNFDKSKPVLEIYSTRKREVLLTLNYVDKNNNKTSDNKNMRIKNVRDNSNDLEDDNKSVNVNKK